jgi:hypothetical protein
MRRAGPPFTPAQSLLAAEIIKTIDKRELSGRKAQALTGIDAGDFSRIRNADFRRMTVETVGARSGRPQIAV